MPITLNGSGTVSGISAGGLPDGCIQSADIASGVIPAGGKVLQVQQTFKNDAASTNSGTYSAVSGLTVSITPSSSINCRRHYTITIHDHVSIFAVFMLIWPFCVYRSDFCPIFIRATGRHVGGNATFPPGSTD